MTFQAFHAARTLPRHCKIQSVSHAIYTTFSTSALRLAKLLVVICHPL